MITFVKKVRKKLLFAANLGKKGSYINFKISRNVKNYRDGVHGTWYEVQFNVDESQTVDRMCLCFSSYGVTLLWLYGNTSCYQPATPTNV